VDEFDKPFERIDGGRRLGILRHEPFAFTLVEPQNIGRAIALELAMEALSALDKGGVVMVLTHSPRRDPEVS